VIEQAKEFIAAIEIQIAALRDVRAAMGRLEAELRAASAEAGASGRAPRVAGSATSTEHIPRGLPSDRTMKWYRRSIEVAREKGRPAAEIAKLERRLAKALAKAEAAPASDEPAVERAVDASISTSLVIERQPTTETFAEDVASFEASLASAPEPAPEPVNREVEAAVRRGREHARARAEATSLDASKLKALGAEHVETTPSGEAAVVVSATPRRGRKIVEV
jgi:hypothetical protein